MKSPRGRKAGKTAAKPAGSKVKKNANLIDPASKKLFLEMRDHWKGLQDRATSAAGKRRQYEGEIKSSGFSMKQIKTSLQVATPEGEAEFKLEMANLMLAAAYSDADIGEQLSLFLDHSRTPAVDRAWKEGQSDAMANKAAQPKYDPSTEQYRAFMEGYHEEQGRQVKAGIGKLDAKAAAANTGKKPAGKPPAKKAAAGGKKRGPKPKPKADAKPAAAPKADAGPPRAAVTRSQVRAASPGAAKAEAESYFSRKGPDGQNTH